MVAFAERGFGVLHLPPCYMDRSVYQFVTVGGGVSFVLAAGAFGSDAIAGRENRVTIYSKSREYRSVRSLFGCIPVLLDESCVDMCTLVA